MLKGDKVLLTALDPGNAETTRGWMNDPEVTRWLLSGHVPITAASESAFYARMESSATDHVFEIHVAEDGRFIGLCGLHDLDPVHRHAEIGITVGDLSAQNHGYGRDAIVTMLRFGFGTLGLHRIEVRFIEGNDRAAHLYPSMGFQPVGILREHIFLRGAYRDEHVLDMLESEFAGRYGHA